MSYADLLRDPRWQRKRLEVMQLADFKCEVCGDDRTTLNVHHREYVRGRKPWEYNADELYCLCEPCHGKEHGIQSAEAIREEARNAERRRVRWELWQTMSPDEQRVALRLREIDEAIPRHAGDSEAIENLIREKVQLIGVFRRSPMGRTWKALNR